MSEFFLDNVTTFDRSELETWAKCPMQAKLKQTSGINSVGQIAETGEQIHQAIGRALKIYIDQKCGLTLIELRDALMFEVRESRPDLQPDAIQGLFRSAYDWASFVCNQPHNAFLRYDGGDEQHSGQLAHDILPTYRITSELDLLLATRSEEMLWEIDYKTGHKQWTADDVGNSFQFQFHAVLVFHNYPGVNVLKVQIWNTRFNKLGCSCDFHRKHLIEYESRIRSAIHVYEEQHNQQEPATWPTREKCGMCDVAAFCPTADKDIQAVDLDPPAFLSETVRLDEIVSARKKLMSQHIDKTGKDITTTEGDSFGNNKPKTSRKPSKAFY